MGTFEIHYLIFRTSNQINKPIVLVQWEDAKEFFDPWTCKPNAWQCKIGIASSNSSFSSSQSTKVLPKVSKYFHSVPVKKIVNKYYFKINLCVIIEFKVSIFHSHIV